MKKAEERAVEEYPEKFVMYGSYYGNGSEIKIDANAQYRNVYLQGFQQAEKDLALTWEDMRELHIIFTEIDVNIELQRTTVKAETLGYYEEALRRFNLKRKEINHGNN